MDVAGTEAAAAVRARLRGMVDGSPTSTVPVDDPRATVVAMAVDAVWLGTYQDVYRLTDEQWEVLVDAAVEYAGLPAPTSSIEFVSLDLETEPFRDERELVDAVLGICVEQGVHAVTLARVAHATGRSEASLQSMFGSVEELLSDVVHEVTLDGFDDLSPLNFSDSPAAVGAQLAAFFDARKAASIYRLFALAGVPRTDDPATDPEYLVGRDLAGLFPPSPADLAGAPRSLLVAALACDGWVRGRGEEAIGYPSVLPDAVADELRRLVAQDEQDTPSATG